ncbi:hypothetical protein OIU34_22730 [Pararhizobium sp. BT-229]|uniref:hypothetical protein n=1 Tax=Pararhizobium sp. BT-229 TaxID=2986923 RepID=UPI0021F7F644|nr:hypothetical protein [Pararhizobium sp. BT-229]MCV9964710.1 hypothetical protein [Pararhizobium sp. BT-229]
MKLEIEYPVILQAVPPRSTLSKTVIVKDVAVADIPEYSASEAPVALRRRRVDPNTHKPWVQDYLHANEGLFIAARKPTIEAGKVPYEFGYEKTQVISPIFHNDMHGEVQEKIGGLKRLHKSNYHKHIFNQDVLDAYVERWERRYRGEPLMTVRTKLPMLGEIKLSNIEEGGVERARSVINKKIANLILVDGRFYIKQPEPVYLANASVHVRDPFVSTQARISEEEMLGAEKIDLSTAYFAADDLEGAIAYAAEMWRIRKGDDNDYDAALSGDAYEVVDPSALRFDGERVSALRAAEAVRRNFMSSIVPSAIGSATYVLERVAANFENTSLEALVNYKHLEAALKTAVDGGNTDDLCARIRDCISGTEGDRFVKGAEAAMLEVALGRWERREARRNYGLMF